MKLSILFTFALVSFAALSFAAEQDTQAVNILARSKAPFTVYRQEQPIVVPQNTDFQLQKNDVVESGSSPVQTIDQQQTNIALNKESSLRIADSSTFEMLTGQMAVIYSSSSPTTILFSDLEISPEPEVVSQTPTIKPVASEQTAQPIMLVDAINTSEVQVFGLGETLLVGANNLEQRLATIPSGDSLRFAKNAATGAWETVSNVPQFLSQAVSNNTQRSVEVVDDRRFGFLWWEAGAAAGGAALLGGTYLLLEDDDDDNDEDDEREFSSPFFPRP